MVVLEAESRRVLKEWSSVVDALGEGIQTMLIRKYPPAHDEFFLYPTYGFSTRKDYLSSYFQKRHHDFARKSAESKDEGVTDIKYYVVLTETIKIRRDNIESLRNLIDCYIWSADHVLNYFQDVKIENAYLWFLRVHKLPNNELVNDLGRGAVRYGYLTTPISTAGSVPVMDDANFQSKMAEIKRKLETPTLPSTDKRFEKEKPKPLLIPKHNEIRDMIRAIGGFLGKVSDTEYPIDSYRLDAAWRRIKAGNPSHVFEVHFGGNFFEALTKLKHSWDKWNSKPFLVTTDKFQEKAEQLLEGSFHEMKDVIRIVNWKKIVTLHKLEKEVSKIKTEMKI